MPIVRVLDENDNTYFPKEIPVFQQPKYCNHYRQKATKVLSFIIEDKGFRVGISGGVLDKTFYSPFSSPYSGFALLGTNYSHQKMIVGLSELEKELISRDVNEIHITQCPEYINPIFNAFLHNALKNQGYQIAEMALNQHIDLNEFDELGLHLKGSAKNKFNQFSKNSFVLNHSNDFEKLKVAYELIAKSRKIRNRPLKMSFEDMKFANEATPLETYCLFHEGNIISSCIGIQVNPKIFHVIYWGHDPEMENLFPMNALSHMLCGHLKKNSKLKYVDLGISTDVTEPDFGLLEFKESIGAKVSLRFSWTKKIA